MDIRRTTSLLAMALFAVALTGCPKEQPTTSNSTTDASSGGSTEAKKVIAVIPKGTGHQFWKAMEAGAKDAGKEENVDIRWIAPNPEGSISGQVNLVRNQITDKVAGIVLAAVDATALVEPVKAAVDAGISVVTVDSGINSEENCAYIATDNVKGGEAAADELAKLMGNKGKVGLLIFGKGSVSSDEREKGFVQGIKKYPNIKLVSTLEANEATKAVNAVTNMLTAHPDLGGIFAANEPNGVGAAQVLRQKSKVGKIKIVAYDSSDEELKALEEGAIQALIVQDPYKMGYEGVKTVMKSVRKETIEPKIIDSGMMVITKANVSTPEAQKLVKKYE